MTRFAAILVLLTTLLAPSHVSARDGMTLGQYEGNVLAWVGLLNRSSTDIIDALAEIEDTDEDERPSLDTTADFLGVLGTIEGVNEEAETLSPPETYIFTHDNFLLVLDRFVTAGDTCSSLAFDLDDQIAGECSEEVDGAGVFLDTFLNVFLLGIELPEAEGTVTTEAATPLAEGTSEAGDGLYTIDGTMTLIDFDETWRANRECSGSGGYDDLREGTDVTVRNGDGDIVGVGRLEAGEPFLIDEDDTTSNFCDFAFEVEVTEERFYTIEVGSRGDLSYSLDDLEESNWTVLLSIGGA